jgi:hypothetical protein
VNPLIPDPFRPGELVRASLSGIHPDLRASHAVDTRLSAAPDSADPEALAADRVTARDEIAAAFPGATVRPYTPPPAA